MARQSVRQRRPWVFEGGFAVGRNGIWQYFGTGTPVNGTSGTGAGEGAPGSKYNDYTNGVEYLNVGTMASPTWTPLSPVAFLITSVQILALATPLNLIPAPPAGFAVIIDNMLMTMTRTATQYAAGSAVGAVYTGGSVAAHSGTLPAAVVTGAAGVVLTQFGPPTAANGTTVPTATGVDLGVAGAAFTTGTGTLKVTIDYRVVPQ